MKRMILAGVVALTAGLSGLLAQTPRACRCHRTMPKSPDELKAVQAIGNAPTPDEAIKASEDLLTNYTDTEFKEYAYTMEARAYQQKRDRVNAEVYGERALQIDPKAFMMELLVGEIIAPNIKDHDLDRDEEIAKANHLFTDAIANIQTATKPSPQISDKDWDDAKKFAIAQAHNGLGILAKSRRNGMTPSKNTRWPWMAIRNRMLTPRAWPTPTWAPARTTRPSPFATSFWPSPISIRHQAGASPASRPRRAKK